MKQPPRSPVPCLHSGIFFQSFGTNAHEIASRSSALQPELEPSIVDCTWKNRYYLVLYWHLAIHLSYSILSYHIVYDITLPCISYISCIISHFLKLLLITLFRRLCFLDSENKEFVILQKLFQVCLFRPFSFLSSAATHSNDAEAEIDGTLNFARKAALH